MIVQQIFNKFYYLFKRTLNRTKSAFALNITLLLLHKFKFMQHITSMRNNSYIEDIALKKKIIVLILVIFFNETVQCRFISLQKW